VGYEFSVRSPQGKDLLDPLATYHFDSTNIRLLWEIDGELVEPYEPHLSLPRFFKVYKHSDNYRLSLTLNYSGITEKTITYIQWDNVDIDTIVTLYNDTNMGILKRKVWVNEQLVWEWTSNKEAYSELVKDFTPNKLFQPLN